MSKCNICVFGTGENDCIFFGCEKNFEKFYPISNFTYLCRNPKKLAELLV